jgi:GT2 family glycosyltransferase
MNGNALVSAVVTTIRRPDLVVRAVRSVLRQTYAPIELIVVVDGPDPQTIQILEAMNEERLTVLPLEKNVGLAEARNIGARECHGKWVAYLDDDDEWLPEKIDIQVKAIDALGSNNILVATQYVVRGSWRKPEPVLPVRAPLSDEDISDYMFRTNGLAQPIIGPQASGYLVSREALLRIPFKAGLKYYEDWEWLLRGISEGMQFVLIKQPLYILYTHHHHPRESNSSGQRWRLSLTWIESVRSQITRDAYSSFMVFDTMFHCAETWMRIPAFIFLTYRMAARGRCSLGHLIGVVKCFLLHPVIRDGIRRNIRSLRSV